MRPLPAAAKLAMHCLHGCQTWCLTWCLLSCLGTATLPSQTEPAATRPPIEQALADRLLEHVRELIEDDDPIRAAWGAHYMGEYHLGELAPQALTMLERFPGKAGKHDFARLHAIDALLRCDQTAPSGVLTNMLAGCAQDAAIVLMSHNPLT